MVGFFKAEVGLGDSEVAKVLLKRPAIVSNGLEKMRSVVTLLADELGLEADGLKRVVLQNPSVFSMAIDTLRDKFGYLEGRFGNGVALRIVSGCSSVLNLSRNNLEEKLEVLSEYFGDDEDISDVLVRQPNLLAYARSRLGEVRNATVSEGVKASLLLTPPPLSPVAEALCVERPRG